MKTLAICSPEIRESFPKGIYRNFSLYDQDMIIGLADFPVLKESVNLTGHQVLVKVKAFSCNYRDRTLIANFNTKCRQESNSIKKIFSPFGSDFVGEVVRTGKSVNRLIKGDRVIPDDTYPYRATGKIGGVPTNFMSQRLLVFDEEQLISIPGKIPDEVAAGFSIAAQTSYSMLRKAAVTEGQHVLVTAATSHTSLALIDQLGRLPIDLSVITSSPVYKEKLYAMGVEKVFLYDSLHENSGSLFDKKIDVVFDPFIDLYLIKLFPSLADGCRYIYCGFYNQYTDIPGPELSSRTIYMNSIFRNISLIGNCLGNSGDLQKAIHDFSNGRFNLPVDSVFQEEDILPFMEKSFGKQPRFGKVIYRYSDTVNS